MSGHSKWSTIRHKKAANDALRGSVFTKLAKAITIAVTKGGGIGEIDKNFALRLAVDKARSFNMPKDNIDRAIAKGLGKGGEELIELTIEVFAPEGVLLIVEVVSDNRNRAVAELRSLIEKHGGRMGEMGSVMHAFERVGIVTLTGTLSESQELELIDLGMIEVVQEEGNSTIYTEVSSMHKVVLYLQESGIAVEAVIGYRPKASVSPKHIEKVEKLVEVISAYEDVQEIYANLG